MSALRTACQNLIDLLELIAELGSYLLLFARAFLSPRAHTAATIVALSSQLAAHQRRVEHRQQPRPRLSPAFRVLWVILSRPLEGWEDLAQLMKPATVKRWHKQGWRLYWRWRSQRRGRPSLGQEMRSMIRKLSRENPLWSAERIRDTLLPHGWFTCFAPAGKAQVVVMLIVEGCGSGSESAVPIARRVLDQLLAPR